jgi:membrane-associated phospholipid phosphatase
MGIKIVVINALIGICICAGLPVLAQNPDIDLLKSINPRNPQSTVWKTASASAYFVPAVATLAPLAYGIIHDDKKARIYAVEMFGSLAISAVIAEGLKLTVNRTRPGDKYPNEVFPSPVDHGQSFPSGHTTLAFATATTMSLEYKKWWIVVPAYLWAFSAGYSRLYFGQHYPTDVLGGMVTGIGSGYLSHYLSRKLFGKQRG